MNDLGYLNSWYDNPPKEYVECREQKHKLIVSHAFSCVARYTCPICELYFYVDSGD